MRLVRCIAPIAVAVLASIGAMAQDAAKIPRVGFLSPLAPNSRNAAAFQEGLRELGYNEGRTIRVEYRWADGRFDRLPGLAQELVDLDVDVIVASVTQASLAAKAATARIPIVIAGVADPVAVGLVPSLARPDTNVTGTSGMAAALVGKQLELLKELSPDAARISVLWNPANPAFHALQLREVESAGRALGVALQLVEARAPDEFDAAFAAIAQAETRALLILADPVFAAQGEALAERAAQRAVATVSGNRLFAEAGGLLAYGPNYIDLHKRAAVYVDKILKGAKPADMPVEQSTRFELVVNLRTARALGLTIPPSVLARADEVIE